MEENPSQASGLKSEDLSREKFPKTHVILEQAIQDRAAPGFVAGLWSLKRPDIFNVRAFGVRRWLPSEQPLTTETIFDLASITKVYGTAMLAAVLIERGKLNWETPVCKVFTGYPFRDIRVRHLLSHTAGFIAWEPLWEKIQNHLLPRKVQDVPVSERQQLMRDLVFSIKPEVPVETRTVYSDISFLLLGFLLEEVTGLALDQAVKEYVWDPIGVEKSSYRHVIGLAVDPEVAATEDSAIRGGILQGQVHDDNCWMMGGYGGHAGAFGNVRDLLHFSRRLFDGFLPLKIRDEMWTKVDWPLGCERTLGWDTPSGDCSTLGSLMSRRSVGHWGYTGTSLWIDRDREIAVTLLSNRVHPTRENNLIRAVRPAFHDALISDLKLLI